jgi:hypothetical protein
MRRGQPNGRDKLPSADSLPGTSMPQFAAAMTNIQRLWKTLRKLENVTRRV